MIHKLYKLYRTLLTLAYQKHHNVRLLAALLSISIIMHYLIYRHLRESDSLYMNCTLETHNMDQVADRLKQDSSRSCTLLKTNVILCKETSKHLPVLYVVTPTYKRPEQIAELTRLSYTLTLVPNLHWMVIEDGTELNPLVTELLVSSGITFQYLCASMPSTYRWRKHPPKGVANRMKALQWIRKHADDNGVIYFADDDNTYDIQLFEEIRRTQRVSAFPVGLVLDYGASSPVATSSDGQFVDFFDSVRNRRFRMDMAGFAVSVRFLRMRPAVSMPFRNAFEEEGFLLSLAPFEPAELELLAHNCTQILVWHTQTRKFNYKLPNVRKYQGTNVEKLVKLLSHYGL